MTAIVNVTEAQRRLEALIDEVARTGKPIPISGDGRVLGWLSPEPDNEESDPEQPSASA